MFSKILIYYSIIYLIHSVIKKNLKKYKKYKNREIKKNLNLNEELSMDKEILYRMYTKKNIDINENINEKSLSFSEINIKEKKIYNINNEEVILHQKNIDINDLYKNLFNKSKNIKQNCDINENSLVLCEEKLNKKSIDKEILVFEKYILNYIVPENDTFNNNLLFDFKTNDNYYYKIICKMTLNNIENIKLVITDNNKQFIYKTEEFLNKINEFSFVLDNNQFNHNEKILIYLYFYNNNKQIEINDFYIEIIQKPLIKAIDPIIIFNNNNNYNPIYINVCNILDFTDYKNKNNDNILFFI
jgi:hypothetical protein